MALLPALVVFAAENGAAEKNTASADSAADSSELIVYACGLSDAEYCDEALAACLILARTNLAAGVKAEIYSSDKEIYTRIENIYNSNEEIFLTYNGKTVEIPSSKTSNGETVKSEKFPYIKAIASPWDLIGGKSGEECAGVSLDGVNYLCENGMSGEEALLWYLPDFTACNANSAPAGI